MLVHNLYIKTNFISNRSQKKIRKLANDSMDNQWSELYLLLNRKQFFSFHIQFDKKKRKKGQKFTESFHVFVVDDESLARCYLDITFALPPNCDYLSLTPHPRNSVKAAPLKLALTEWKSNAVKHVLIRYIQFITN